MRRVGPDTPQLNHSHNMAAGHHSTNSLRRGPAAIQHSITHSLRRRKRPNGRDDYSAVNPLVKYFLFVLNCLFLLIGAAMTAVGIYILDKKDKVVTSFIDFIFDPACVLTLVGCIVLVIAFFACGGALRESICFLQIYYIVLSIFLLLEIVAVIFVFVFYFVDGAFADIGLYPEDAFKDAVRNYRDDPDMQGFIDSIQETLSCCGASNDDLGYMDWNANPYFNCSKDNLSPERCNVPFSCCRVQEGDQINYRCGTNMMDESTTDRSAIYTQGCLKGIQEIITGNIWIAGGVIIGILIPQAMFICCAKALVAQIQEQMSKW